jgi:carbon storage regulator
MLVISRKSGEKLRIGENVEITVLEISGSRVVVGIDAPREIAIRRVGPSADGAEEDLRADPDVDAASGLGPTDHVDTAFTPKPFEYPSRAAPEPTEKRVKTPVVTVRRSRKIAIPTNGEFE